MSRFGEWQGYIGEPCKNCGRYRVAHYSSGFEFVKNAVGASNSTNIFLMMNFMKMILRGKENEQNK